MSTFILELPLKTEVYQQDMIDKHFNVARMIYNSMVNVTSKRYKEMIKTKKYRSYMQILADNKIKAKGDKKAATKKKLQLKEAKEGLNKLRIEYDITRCSFQKDIKPMQYKFKNHIDSATAQVLSDNLWAAYERLMFGDGKSIHYKKYNELNCLVSKSNAAGIRYRDGYVYWLTLKIPVIIDMNNQYETEALKNKIKFCKIKKEIIRNKKKYYVQIALEGTPPLKFNEETGEVKRYPGCGDVGLDIGTQTLAYSSASKVGILELADKVNKTERERKILLRKLDRSRRATNPDNYNEDGTIKKGRKLEWKRSNKYIKNLLELKETYRKQRVVRQYQHECLANQIIALGDKFYVEDMNFKALQKRAKKEETDTNTISEETKPIKKKRRKRFGKSIGNKAPSMFLNILNRKLHYYALELVKIDTWNAKASQFNHTDGTYKKKKLSQRWNNINGVKVQRDMYSAFLIMNVNPDLKTFNNTKCNNRYETFLKLHNEEVNRLKGNKNLSSIAI